MTCVDDLYELDDDPYDFDSDDYDDDDEPEDDSPLEPGCPCRLYLMPR